MKGIYNYMKKQYLDWKKLFHIIAVVLIIEFAFLIGAYHQIHYKTYNQSDNVTDGNVDAVTDGVEVVQTFKYDGDYINYIAIKVGTYNRENKGKIEAKLLDSKKNEVISEQTVDISKLKNNEDFKFSVKKDVKDYSGFYKMVIVGVESTDKNAITFYSNSNGDIHNGKLSIAEKAVDGELEMSVYGDTIRKLGRYYGVFFLIALILIILWYVSQKNKEQNGKLCVLHNLCQNLDRYHFLMKQLVSRDFKTKYKRSVLGFFWSFLNPLLTMLVQYAVFSTIFRANIENYPVYLLSATVLFSFFTESVGGGLGSIVFNAPLIKKVYVPKYIYPVSKVLSTAINLCISLVPLIAVILITGARPNIAYVLIPFVLICLIIFCIGMSLILSSLMVFFRDVQFLWSIISLLWMYATPMFYPEDIIPDKFHFVLTANPMYHFISFFRTIILNNASPQMGEYVYCLGFSGIICIIGAVIFNHTQKKFVLYL